MSWSVLLKFWPVAVITIFLGIIGYEHLEVTGLQAKLTTANAATATLSADLTIQNAAVKSLKADEAALTATNAAQVKAAVQAAQAGRTGVSKQVAAINAEKAGADTCKSALDLIHGAIQ